MIALLLVTSLAQGADSSGFDHLKHKGLFPLCTTCHAGAETQGASLWPAANSCAACHDGKIEKVVAWSPRTQPRRTNLRFDHVEHSAKAKDKPAPCTACHTEAGAPRMAVRPPVVARCLDCHGIRTAHLVAPDSACATCHVALARAVTLTRSDVADFPAPPSHDDPRWPARDGHGAVLRSSLTTNCATCHAQEFCYQCHAGGTPPRVIAALASDPRSTALAAHRAPASHGGNFADRHAAPASASTASCSSCHLRRDCLECHRTTAANAPGYHPGGFVSRHPAAAYARETTCSDCHSERSFCAACHQQSGVVAMRGLRTSYHDANRFFSAGHGGAARQSLESCVSCHAERDCLTCHSALGGRHYNPHGPGFDAERLRRKNIQMCTVCHGTSVPAQ
ncbi:MAG TPA: hypothetical protein VFO67_04490 [Gemmatimonadales bacterium]|nr:hypothetical protein [Gemmatimonadales bacterium]